MGSSDPHISNDLHLKGSIIPGAIHFFPSHSTLKITEILSFGKVAVLYLVTQLWVGATVLWSIEPIHTCRTVPLPCCDQVVLLAFKLDATEYFVKVRAIAGRSRTFRGRLGWLTRRAQVVVFHITQSGLCHDCAVLWPWEITLKAVHGDAVGARQGQSPVCVN